MQGTATQIDLAQLLTARAAFGAALAAELGARLGRELRVEPGPHQALGVLELAENDEPIVHQALPFASGEGAVHLVLPQRDARLLAALEQAVAADALDAALAEALDAPRLGALAQVLESVADVMRSSFAGASWPALGSGAPSVVSNPKSEATWVEDSIYLRLQFTLAVEGVAPGHLAVLIRQVDLAGDLARGESVCFITLGELERKRISALEAELGASAVTLEPRELQAALDERVLGASLVVVPWEIAGRSGLELVESLARDARALRGRLALGVSRPTRALIAAALRAGAATVISHPYDGPQLRAAREAAKS